MVIFFSFEKHEDSSNAMVKCTSFFLGRPREGVSLCRVIWFHNASHKHNTHDLTYIHMTYIHMTYIHMTYKHMTYIHMTHTHVITHTQTI